MYPTTKGFIMFIPYGGFLSFTCYAECRGFSAVQGTLLLHYHDSLAIELIRYIRIIFSGSREDLVAVGEALGP